MKRVLLSLGLSVLCLVVASNLVFAGPHDQARFAMHANNPWVSTKAIPNLCADNPNAKSLSCLDYTVNRPAPDAANVWIVLGQAGTVGVTGLSFGVDYSGSAGIGVDPQYVTFTYCGDGLSFPNAPDGLQEHEFPYPGGGIRVTYSNCQNQVLGPGVQVVVGALYVYAYSPDTVVLTPNNNLQSGIPELAITQCGGGTTYMDQVLAGYGGVDGVLGKVGFGNTTGYNPCGVVPARETTWGKLKNLYNKN